MAVYTQLAHADMAAALKDWGLGTLTDFGGIAEGVENTTYWIATTQGKFIVSIYEKRVHKDDLPFFLSLMQHLARKGIPCPQPCHRSNGQLFGQVQNKPMAVVSFLPGQSIYTPTRVHCAALGDMLGRLHVAQTDFAPTRPNALSAKNWSDILTSLKHPHAQIPKRDIAAQLHRLITQWPKPNALPRGIIHADIFPDNVFFDNDNLSGVVDFYFACEDFLAYDIAIALNAWAFAPDGTYCADNARALLAAYQAHRQLEALEISALPVLAGGAAMRFLLTRLLDDGAHPHSKDPMEYFTRLQFHANQTDAFRSLAS